MSPVILISFAVLGAIFMLYWIGAFLIIYHLIRFGIGSEPKKAVTVFFIGSALLSFIAAVCFGFALFNSDYNLERFQNPIPEGGLINLNNFRIFEYGSTTEQSMSSN